MARRAVRALALLSLGVAAVLALDVGGARAGAKRWIKGVVRNPFGSLQALDARAARRVFPEIAFRDGFRFDPDGLLLAPVDSERVWNWPEHAGGRIVLRTNGLGLSDDDETRIEHEGLRVLVVGDSHTQGIVPNAESFANRLEVGLRERHPGVEVLNAGVAYTGPHCYLARVRYYEELQPDVVVAVLFTGNDFHDEVLLSYALDGWTPPYGDVSYRRRLDAALALDTGAVQQGLNQIARFEEFPEEQERGFAEAVSAFETLAEEYRAKGRVFLAVVLPTKLDVEPEDVRATVAGLAAALELPPAELALNARLGARFAAAMERRGVPCLDPLAAMRAAPAPLYWRRDHHLGTAGHALLAELLRARLEELL